MAEMTSLRGPGGGERDTALSRRHQPLSSPQRSRRPSSDPIMKRPCADFEEKREPRGGRHSKEDLPYKPQSEKAVRQ